MDTKIHNKAFIERGYREINPVDCGYMECPPSHGYGPAGRKYWLLHFIISGKGHFKTARGEYLLGKNNIFIIKPGEINYYEADEKDPWKYVWIAFTAEIDLPYAFTNQDTVYINSLRDPFLGLVDLINDKTKNLGYVENLCSVIWTIIAEFRKLEASAEKNRDSYVKEAINIMEVEYHRSISISEIAERLHINRSYLSIIFKEITKSSPHEYLKKLRMERAAEMLKCGEYTVGIIATSVGYSDLFVFSRAFKDYFGVSPSRFT